MLHIPISISIGGVKNGYIWLDGNVPFYGTYESDTQLAQKNGISVPPPTLQ